MRAALLMLALALGAFGPADERARVVGLWNRFAEATRAETETDLLLHRSLQDFRPEYLAGPYEPRRELYDEAIRLSEERTRLLREMRAAEFGREGK
jgi:hypothetical protein